MPPCQDLIRDMLMREPDLISHHRFADYGHYLFQCLMNNRPEVNQGNTLVNKDYFLKWAHLKDKKERVGDKSIYIYILLLWIIAIILAIRFRAIIPKEKLVSGVLDVDIRSLLNRRMRSVLRLLLVLTLGLFGCFSKPTHCKLNVGPATA